LELGDDAASGRFVTRKLDKKRGSFRASTTKAAPSAPQAAPHRPPPARPCHPSPASRIELSPESGHSCPWHLIFFGASHGTRAEDATERPEHRRNTRAVHNPRTRSLQMHPLGPCVSSPRWTRPHTGHGSRRKRRDAGWPLLGHRTMVWETKPRKRRPETNGANAPE
jgi:hypothetical protein